jgi:hypothetical protein
MGKITKKAKVTVADAKDKVKAGEETKDKVASSSTSIGSQSTILSGPILKTWLTLLTSHSMVKNRETKRDSNRVVGECFRESPMV